MSHGSLDRQWSSEELGAEDVRRYHLHLINDKRLALTSVVGAVAALRFLYQVTLKQGWAVHAIISPKRAAAPAPRAES